ncbi:Zinc finger protein 423 homolog [Strongyloides ratti]|uniref:Zinc finger protein 423 homolog n=1 Tax=Strongyloides ratti TaxID=34506 RepID=A0A090L9T6_STRRB|nr:Zinc finger protein 423 homolog [Strongyloides ratti]CEF66512.1 Zinc finger protein 423 homolog [Strongyloides ratti]
MSKKKIGKFMSEEKNSTKNVEISNIYSTDSSKIFNPFECYFCKTIFINSEDLQKHIFDIHTNEIVMYNGNSNKFVCQQCYKEYNDFNLFADHMKSHINNLEEDIINNSKSCPVCKQIFSTNKLLELHILDHFLTTTSSFICPYCPDEVFYNDNSYRQHYIKKHSETFYRCSHCLQFFSQYNLFQDHMLIHRKEIIQYNCIICSITFPNLDIFTNHIQLIHDNGNRILPIVVPFIQQKNSLLNISSDDEIKSSISLFSPKILKCSVCDIECTSQFALDNHRLQVHCKIGKSNKCGICHKILDGKVLFIEHSLEHKIDKSQISCCVCRQTVKSQWQLSMHAEFHLNDVSPLTSLIFKNNKTLLEKMVNNNEKKQILKCDSNNENILSPSLTTSVVFSEDQERKKLIEINEFTCSVCLKQFTSLNALQGHSHIHRNARNHKCCLCKMAFSTKGRLELHKKKHYCNKEIKCQICDEKFNKNDLFKEHMKTHESNLKNIS